MISNVVINFLLGVVVGGSLVGCSVERTISASRGHTNKTMVLTAFNSVTYYFSVAFIAKENVVAYLGTTVGSLIAVWFISSRNRKRRGL